MKTTTKTRMKTRMKIETELNPTGVIGDLPYTVTMHRSNGSQGGARMSSEEIVARFADRQLAVGFAIQMAKFNAGIHEDTVIFETWCKLEKIYRAG